ncbi:MAG TPA: purine-nucleoside phosphorylase [bacterium]|nr:purine-nucleoside phosphorylase [bacterium]
MASIREAAQFIGEKLADAGLESGRLAMVLGSGLGNFADSIEVRAAIPYRDIPNFPVSTVTGHAGKLLLAAEPQSGRPFWVMQGRVHCYEGYTPQQAVFPIRVLRLLGVETVFLTNAAGGIRDDLLPGSFMLVADHLNLTGMNPLTGPNLDGMGTRFPDMTEAYDPSLRRMMRTVAAEQGVVMAEGVYAGLAGPCFETPAEIRMLEKLGADAVGMSTVPETIAAHHAGMRVAAVSFIANRAAGKSEGRLSHEEVFGNAKAAEGRFGALMLAAVGRTLGDDA